MEWTQTLGVSTDPEVLVGALWTALADTPPPPPLGFGHPSDAGTTERRTGLADAELVLRETWEWQRTRDDDVLACAARVWEAVLPAASLRLEWWPQPSMRVTVRAESVAMARAQAALWSHVDQSPDEIDVLAALARSEAFARDVFGSAHRRLRELHYSPMRLYGKSVGDHATTLAALDRTAAQRPSVAVHAVLAAAVLEALAGRLDQALSRVDAADLSSLELRLLRVDLLSRLGRHDEALGALPELGAADEQAHAVAALRVAILRRMGRLPEAVGAALALGDLPSAPGLSCVPSSSARAAALLLAEDAGDDALAGLARERLGEDAALVAQLARRGIPRPAQWFLVAHAPVDRLAALAPPRAR